MFKKWKGQRKQNQKRKRKQIKNMEQIQGTKRKKKRFSVLQRHQAIF